ncbi:hypothetical protein DAPPUDRAFT_72874 [Daphnia pulex]|uniref:Uncharacterized protein n=1 Tax=Daphnia pulex TaxID=6669 RepID=E9I7F4_DAPPU|nr:hypothetical protein DAPPUDRAFT_72874 [Daphnia pulex]|eukprot:EFX60076.1 hypothetical protein DAPPUDRAFT_72874 [Daphnia pulex]
MGGSVSTPAKPEDEKVVAEDPVIVVPEIDKLLDRDPYLKLHETEIRRRYGVFDKLRKEICESEGGIDKFTTAYKSFGIHINEDNSVTCKEWAPGARQLYLYGDFSMLNFAVFCFSFYSNEN